MILNKYFKIFLVISTLSVVKSEENIVCPYGWQWDQQNALCTVNCTEHSKNKNINCQLPPFSNDVVYDSENNSYRMKPGKSLNTTLTNCYPEVLPSIDRNASIDGQLTYKSGQSNSYCFPLSPQFLQCKKEVAKFGNYIIKNGTELVIPGDKFTAYFGDYYIDGNGTALTCAQNINSSFYSYSQPRCHYISLFSHEYVLTDSGSMFIPEANFTIQNPSYSFVTDNVTRVCIPMSIQYLNCPFRIKWEPYYYQTNSDLMVSIKFLNKEYSLDNYYIDKYGSLIVCLDEEDTYVSPVVNDMYIVCLGFNIVSTACLITTIIIKIKFYLSNYHTKALLFHIICLIVMYICTVIKRYVEAYNVVTCYFMFICLYYSYMGTFFWLNIIAYDSLISFGKFQTLPYPCKALSICRNIFSNKNRFLRYNIYAWGMALLLTIITLAIDLSPMPSNIMALHPQINSFCWFNNKESTALFFYAPLGFLMLINLIFFILTLYIVRYGRKESGIVNHRKRNQTFKVAIKLFCVMSLVWIVNVVCFSLNAFDTQNFKTWFISTLLTSAQGIVIFIVYFVKKETLKSIVNACRVNCCLNIIKSKDDTTPLHADSIMSDFTVCTNNLCTGINSDTGTPV